jgi:hypothetical protein
MHERSSRKGESELIRLLSTALREIIPARRDREMASRYLGIGQPTEPISAVAASLGLSTGRTSALIRRSLHAVAFAGQRARPAPACAAVAQLLDALYRQPDPIDADRLERCLQHELGHLPRQVALGVLAGLSGHYPHESTAARRKLRSALTGHVRDRAGADPPSVRAMVLEDNGV